MNVGEYGQTFRFNVGQDISSAIPTLVLLPRFGDAVIRSTTDGVTVPATAIEVNGITFQPNEYVEYVIKENDLTYAGAWRAKLKAEYSPTNVLITDYQRFTVMP